jgi:ParB family chromosome partitioning protein
MTTITNIAIEKLIPYSEHQLSLYEGVRLEQMVESIRENGILHPLIVRPKGADYEILSGHNRANAAEIAGISDVPCIVKDVDDNEAMLVVTTTNINQRSFADWKHSERASVLKQHLDALKMTVGQGRRSDLLEWVEEVENGDFETCSQFEHKLITSTSAQMSISTSSAEKTAETFGMSRHSVHRYIRLTYLTPNLIAQVDEEKIGVIPAVKISYLSPAEQSLLETALEETGIKLDLKKAEELKYFHERKAKKGGLNEKDIAKVLKGLKKSAKVKDVVALPKKMYTKFFADGTPQDDIVSTIEKALAMYFNMSVQGEIEAEEFIMDEIEIAETAGEMIEKENAVTAGTPPKTTADDDDYDPDSPF